jgi:two-component system, sensor histidine kinase and response regulator
VKLYNGEKMNLKMAPSVIIVDDNTNNLHVLAHILRDKGLKVATVKDGFKALKFIQHKKPDLVLLDIMMPEMDGYEVCKELKGNDNTKDIPIIFITAMSNTEDKIRGFELGGVDYITKPFRKEEVFSRVNVHLTLKYAQEELKITNQKLRVANATKDQFFSIIAHDLRGPVASLAGLLEMAATNPDVLDKADRSEIFYELKSSAQNVYHLLENLLSWAKSQQGRMRCEPEKIYLSRMIKNVNNLFSTIAKQKGIILHSEVLNDTTVYADTNMLMTVLRNLISNAIKFTSDSGHICISAKTCESFIEVTVKDTGVGILNDHLYKLFQAENYFTTYGTQNEKGSGLGLLLCKEFVEKNGGKIWVESKPKQGSRIIFTLPAEPPSNNIER